MFGLSGNVLSITLVSITFTSYSRSAVSGVGGSGSRAADIPTGFVLTSMVATATFDGVKNSFGACCSACMRRVIKISGRLTGTRGHGKRPSTSSAFGGM